MACCHFSDQFTIDKSCIEMSRKLLDLNAVNDSGCIVSCVKWSQCCLILDRELIHVHCMLEMPRWEPV
jgi:hypothetical protein